MLSRSEISADDTLHVVKPIPQADHAALTCASSECHFLHRLTASPVFVSEERFRTVAVIWSGCNPTRWIEPLMTSCVDADRSVLYLQPSSKWSARYTPTSRRSR